MTPAGKYYVGQKTVSNCLTPGIKIWTNAVPLRADTYKSCSNLCAYCFARSFSAGLIEKNGIKYDPRHARVMDEREIARWFQEAHGPRSRGFVHWAIRGRYFIELGTMGEAFAEEDLSMRHTWNFLQLTGAYQMPLFINTKANLLVRDDNYFRLLAEYPAPVIISLTLTTLDDSERKRLEPFAPTVEERLGLISRLREVGIPTVVYLGPFMPGVSDVDLPGYTREIISAGAVGVHVRDFYLTGKLLATRRWKNYIAAHAPEMKRNGAGWRLQPAVLESAYNTIQETADKIDPRFQVVGVKSQWFDLNPHYGKMAWDWLPDRFRAGLMDFSAIPILRAIRKNIDAPQRLEWGKIGYKPELVRFPAEIPLAGGGCGDESNYLRQGCFACTVGYSTMGKKWVDGWGWIKGGLWNGMEGTDKPAGFMPSLKHIYPVTERAGVYSRSGDDYVYAYIPTGLADQYVGNDGSVPEHKAAEFYAPVRAGGVEDKFEPAGLSAFDLGPRWGER